MPSCGSILLFFSLEGCLGLDTPFYNFIMVGTQNVFIATNRAMLYSYNLGTLAAFGIAALIDCTTLSQQSHSSSCCGNFEIPMCALLAVSITRF